MTCDGIADDGCPNPEGVSSLAEYLPDAPTKKVEHCVITRSEIRQGGFRFDELSCETVTRACPVAAEPPPAEPFNYEPLVMGALLCYVIWAWLR